MQLVIDQSDFKRLSPEVQTALIQALGGGSGQQKRPSRSGGRLHWRRPVDLKPEEAMRLVHGLPEEHRRRLALFARKDGRVRMKEMQALYGDPDLRAASEFQRAMTRRLRRLIEDPEKKAQLIAWDFEATKWDKKKTTIVDGTYYVTPATAKALERCLHAKQPKSS